MPANPYCFKLAGDCVETCPDCLNSLKEYYAKVRKDYDVIQLDNKSLNDQHAQLQGTNCDE